MATLLALIRRYVADEAARRLPADDLWARFRDHRDEAAFRVFLEWTGPKVFARCRAVLRNEALAEEAFQDAFVELVRKRAALPGHGAAVAWVLGTATNKAKDLARRTRRAANRDKLAGAPSGESVPPDAALLAREDADAVHAALADLPARERQALELVYLEGLTHADAAAALGWSRGSVGKYVQRGLERLRGKLGLAAGGVAAAEAAVRAAVPAFPAGRLAGLIDAVWAKADPLPAAGAWWPSGRTLVGVTVVTAGAAAAGFAWLAPAPSDRVTTPAVAASPPPEAVTARNLRVFHADVLPAATAALRDAVIGGGDVALESVEAFDTRVDCVFALRHRLPGAAGWVSRLRVIRDADDRHTLLFFDLSGGGRYRDLKPDRPIILWRNPGTGGEWVVRPAPLAAAVAAFDALPRDDRTAAASADSRARIRDALAVLGGVWYRRGDPVGRREVIVHREGSFLLGGDGAGLGAYDRFRVDDAGRLVGLMMIDSRMTVSPDGRRLDFPDTGDWWTRDPNDPS